ncbi:MAG: GNAT family N-acetyltransferase [Anaerolineaceae bacterium]
MTKNGLEGKLVRLCAVNKDVDAELYSQWDRDSDYVRLADIGPSYLYPITQIQHWMETTEEGCCNFMIETIVDNKRIGSLGLDDINWMSRCAWVGIGIGDPDYRGKGYGTEAMNLLLCYAFNELNLHRVQLSVFEINQRGIRSYEKCGFKYEGTEHEFNCKEGKRWDVVNMGILQKEWQLNQEN